MAWSLARDVDLRFDEGDLARIRSEYPSGPQGLFLKRASGGLTLDAAAGFPWLRRVRPDEGRLYYAKAFAHPLVAAPLVAVLGTRGLTLANGLLLSLALWLAFASPAQARPRTLGGPWRGPGPAAPDGDAALPGLADAGDLRPRPRDGGARGVGVRPAAARGRPLRRGRVPEAAERADGRSRSASSRSCRATGERLAGPGLGRGLRETLRRGAVLVLTAGEPLRAERRVHRRAQLPGRRAQDLLRPLPVRRERHHLRRQRRAG